MDYGRILAYLQSSKHEVLDDVYAGIDCIKVNANVAGNNIELIHFCIEHELTSLPHFYLLDAQQYGELAHVLWCGDQKLWYVCVNDHDAVSVNFEVPELAYEESLNRTIKLLEDLLSNEAYNQQELLREFKVNWANLGSTITQKMICASESGKPELLEIYHPLENQKLGIKNHYLGLSHSAKQLNARHILGRNTKQTKAGGIGLVIPIYKNLKPAPRTTAAISSWYLTTIEMLSTQVNNSIKALVEREKHYIYWLVFNGYTKSGNTWFGLKLHNDKKRKLPTTPQALKHWSLDKFDVEVLNKDLLLPRSGANPALANKKILLAGCGSVGSELAMKLGAAGIGRLDLCDPDILTLSNTYRHALSKDDIGDFKVLALTEKLMSHFPWLCVYPLPTTLATLNRIDTNISQSITELLAGITLDKKLLPYLNKANRLDEYDLIIIAIGSPTQERQFHKYLQQSNCQTPVINTWLEGYGVGGHAILDLAKKRGCFDCAYVDEFTGLPSLASNLNFLQQNQSIVRNHAGCGESYIPYGAVTSTQTALLAADLAIKYLENRIKESTKVSFKGDADDAIAADIKLAPRYDSFDQSLVKTPLYHPQCHHCCGEAAVTYQGCGFTFHFTQDVFEQFSRFKQINETKNEAAGLLIASGILDEKTYWINGITTPKSTDTRTSISSEIDYKQQNLEVQRIFTQTNGKRAYLGTWHTHPNNDPSPSKLDKQDWCKHTNDNPDRPLIFVIVGIKQLKVYSYYTGKLSKLRRLK